MTRSTPDRRRRQAGALLVLTSVLWLHEWLPALFVAAFVGWLAVHKRLEGDLGDALWRYWRRAWPPRAFVLVPALAASMLAYWVLAPMPGSLSPIGLDAFALALLLLGGAGARTTREMAFVSSLPELLAR